MITLISGPNWWRLLNSAQLWHMHFLNSPVQYNFQIYPAFGPRGFTHGTTQVLKCFAHGIAYKNLRARQIQFIILHLQHWLHVTSHSRDFTTPLLLQWIPSHATAPVSSLFDLWVILFCVLCLANYHIVISMGHCISILWCLHMVPNNIL